MEQVVCYCVMEQVVCYCVMEQVVCYCVMEQVVCYCVMEQVVNKNSFTKIPSVQSHSPQATQTYWPLAYVGVLRFCRST